MSREEVLALVSVQAGTIETLAARRLGQNSRNSSKPPSSDGAEQVAPRRSLRRKTGRNPGNSPVRRQVTDIAPAKARVTNVPAPAGLADVPASYGPNLRMCEWSTLKIGCLIHFL
ncbi:DUF6444 domain-containing protein [Streptomyces sp. NPDC090499]|uniref:DUF6444 domain-containing protein n=1 Tax=Streptomyces sp. NPDC090499 TaxID=3365965 RepID=UPI0038177744